MGRPRTFPQHLKNRFGKVSVYRTSNGGYTSYKIVWNDGAERRKESRADEESAIDRANEILSILAKGAAGFPDATSQQWAYYRRCEEMLGEVPLLSAVEFYLQNAAKRPVTETVETEEMIQRYIESRKVAGRGDRYVRSLTYDLTPVGRAMRKTVDKVTVSDLDAFLARIKHPRTRHNKRISIVSCWRWARSKGWLPSGQPTAADLTDSPDVPQKDPEIITHNDLAPVLRAAEWSDTVSHLVPYLAIAAFAGVRSAEICRMTWEDNIRLDEGVLILGSGITKTKRRRVVQMEPILVEWLTAHRSTGKVVKVRGLHTSLAVVNPAGWPHNALRHSAVSYLMALHRNAALVAEQCGHTESQLQSDYKAAVTADEASRWFSIKPTRPKQWLATQIPQKVASA
jgi:integrase